MLRAYQRRYHIADIGHLWYALAYFDDAEQEPMPEMLWDAPWSVMRQTIESWVRAGIADAGVRAGKRSLVHLRNLLLTKALRVLQVSLFRHGTTFDSDHVLY
jgi:hypothetical protein